MNFLFLFSILKMLADPGEKFSISTSNVQLIRIYSIYLKILQKRGDSKCKSVLYYDCVKELFFGQILYEHSAVHMQSTRLFVH